MPNRFDRKVDYRLFILFLIWPFLALIFAIKYYSLRTSKIIVYLFLILYGATFVISSKGLDSYRYSKGLIAASIKPIDAFWDILHGIFATNNSVDILGPLITFIVSRVTSAHQVFFAIIAAIFSYFYLKSINKIVDDISKPLNINILLFVIFFAFINPVFNINGFRFWTAAWMYFFGAYYIVVYNERKYLLVCLLAPLMHFSFFSVYILLLIYSLFGNRNAIYITLLILSFIIPNFLSEYISSAASFLGVGIENKMEAYTNKEYISTVKENTEKLKWFMTSKMLYYYILGVLFYTKYFIKKYANSIEIQNLFSFSILFLSYANFLAVVPSGGRFITVFLLFGTTYIIKFFDHFEFKRLHWITIIGFFPFIVNILVVLRQGAETMNIWLFAFMPFPFIGDPIHLAKLLF